MYVISCSNYSVEIVDESTIEFHIKNKCLKLFEGNNKECIQYLVNLEKEWGYTGPIWGNLKNNNQNQENETILETKN